MSSVGGQLRARRESQQLTIADVADRLSIPAEWIEDLEADRFDAYGNEVHAQAAVRLYAEALDMDADALLREGGVSVTRTGATFEPRLADAPTRGEMTRFVVQQAMRSADGPRVLAIIAGLEILAGIGVVIVRSGG